MRSAEDIVRTEVLACASVMMSELQGVADQLDDSDTYMELQTSYDYDQPAQEFVLEDADLDQLEEVADMFSFFSEALEKAGIPEDVTSIVKPHDEDEDEETYSDLEEWLDDQPNRKELENNLRHAVLKMVEDSSGGSKEVCEEYNLDPDYNDVYEHWIVSDWLGRKLEEMGETVHEYLGFTIWARCTTGQSISMDYVIRKIAGEE